MDRIDELLIAALVEDGRASVATLGRRVGLSRTTVQGRLERLERTGVIDGYTVKLGDDRYRSGVRAIMMITVRHKDTQRVERALRDTPEVRELHAVSGGHDLVAVVQTSSLETLNAAMDRIGALEGVERTLSSIVLATKFRR